MAAHEAQVPGTRPPPDDRLPHRHRIAGNAASVVVAGWWCGAGWRICHGAACRGGERRPNNNETQKGRLTTQPAFKNTRCFRLDDTLLEHGLSHLHEAGDVGALHVVNMTVGLCTELNASLVDALHDVVQLIVNFLG